MVRIVSTKRLLFIILVLLLIIAITALGLSLFNNYLSVPYNPFDDPREYEREKGDMLEDYEIPDIILEKLDNAVDEYQKSLESKGVNNLKIARNYTLLYTDGKYHSKYLVVDTKNNKILLTLYFRCTKNGLLKSLTAKYRYFNDNVFFTYNESLINLEILNISEIDKNNIITTSKNKPTSSWKLGKYSYDFFKETLTKDVYVPIRELRTVTIFI